MSGTVVAEQKSEEARARFIKQELGSESGQNQEAEMKVRVRLRLGDKVKSGVTTGRNPCACPPHNFLGQPPALNRASGQSEDCRVLSLWLPWGVLPVAPTFHSAPQL